FDGLVLRPLDAIEVGKALEHIARVTDGGGPGAVAICFLHSYANPAHEETAVRLVRERLPDWFVCAAREVLPAFREYERFSTAVLNAYIGPLVGRYLASLTATLASRGHAGKVFITTSSGGITTAEVAARLPVHTVLSGPAGGVAAALHLGRITGLANLITC